ncbi:glycosyltransferase family 25 protein [Acinetobacter haemolyticus]|uniref:Glycosyl transferase n=1 Tax=Acinetobacter haemolyticus TaxID=29430 RepID=A0AAJ2YQ88_ACIHA|nr:glycosyltransferase family 25 protein [Acinetobacter haemolyticus]NAR64333.1 glycosyl transferase [Acinetobacter haemolyticus]NAR72365.1 glycosyl transferase [Acinetobacter haemolyticus]
MKKFVISLPSAHERRAHISSQFANQGIEFSFFDAVTPDIAADDAKEMKLNVHESYMAKGELACFMSHVHLWQKIVDENLPYMAIFEDDIHLGERANIFLNQSDWIEKDWQLVKLEAFTPKVVLGAKCKEFSNEGRDIYKLVGENLGTAGYVLSLYGAKFLLNEIRKVEYLVPLDNFMFEYIVKDKKITMYQMQPALCIQDTILNYRSVNIQFRSQLTPERKKRMRANKAQGIQKIFVEFSRIVNQLKIIFFARRVTYK